MNHRFKKGFLALLIATSICAQAAEIAVIVNPAFDASSLDENQVAQVFLGKSQQMTPYDQPESAPIREQFYTKLTGRSLAQVKATWLRLVFSGRAQLPAELQNSEEIKRAVAEDFNGIGYIKKTAVDNTVQVVITLP